MQENVALALILTAFAGLSTGIGSAIAFLVHRSNRGFLAIALGFSAGVMVYISFVEMLPTASSLLAGRFGEEGGNWIATASLFAGMLLIGVIDYLVPSYANPHDAVLAEEVHEPRSDHKLHRLGLFTALAIGIHNFPEGVVTFFATLTDPAVGVSIAIAIALHNIPEGISVAVPVYYATGSRRKALIYSFLSGLAEPLGAILAFLVLRTFLSNSLMGVIYGAVAGIMIFVSLDQLVPNAKKYGESHHSVYGLVAGMAVMAVTLLLL